MPFATVALNDALGAILVDRIRLHSGDPGPSGTNNPLGGSLSVAAFGVASAGQRTLTNDVTVTGLSPNQSVTYFSVWWNTGTIFKGGFPLSGDLQANAAGEYIVKATTTKLTAT